MTKTWLSDQIAQNVFPTEPRALILLGTLLFSVILLGGLASDILLLSRRRSATTWASSCQHLRWRPWSCRDLGFITFAVFTLIVTVSWWQALRAGQATAWAGIALYVGIFLTVIGYSVMMIRIRNVSAQQAFGIQHTRLGKDIRTGGFLYLAFMPPFILAGALYAAALEGLNLSTERQDIIRAFTDPSLPIWLRGGIAIMAIVLAPVWEEVFFRGIATSALLKIARPWLVIAGVSVLFAVVHANIAAVFPLFLLAVALSLAYIRTGTLIVPIVMHAVFNAATLTFALLFKDIN